MAKALSASLPEVLPLNGVAMDAQQARHRLAGLRWPTGQQIEHLLARRFVPIVFASELQRERVGMFAHDRRATFRFVSLSSPRP